MKKKKLKKKKIFFLLFLTVILLAIFAFYLFLKLGRFKSLKKNSGDTLPKLETNEVIWKEYKNEKFRYSLLVPQHLLKKEVKNEEGYLSFVRFEENELTRAKRVAVGVSRGRREDEVDKVKEQMNESGLANLIKEVKINVSGHEAKRLDYQAIDSKNRDPRAIVIFDNGIYTYSISTHPEQAEKIIESFKVW